MFKRIRNSLIGAAFLLFSHSIAHAAIVINEVMISNDSTVQDPFGEYSDWVELYNNGGSTVNLGGWLIADSVEAWVFPPVNIAPGQHLIVWCNNENDTSTLSTSFTLSGSGEDVSLLRPNITFEDQVVVPDLGGDESYGRIPNGSGNFEIMFVPTPGSANVSSNLPPNPDAGLITINEASNNNDNTIADMDGDYPDWIELFNKGPRAVNMAGLKIADSGTTWTFPNITLNAGQYLVVFASGKNRTVGELHTNFGLSGNGETVQYLNADNTLVESVFVGVLNNDQSYGRFPNGTGAFQTFASPTPGQNNYINSPPILNFIGDQNVAAGSTLNFTISGSDVDGDPLTYSAVGLPAGSTFNPTTRQFSWSPIVAQIGDYVVTFTVSDGSLTDSEQVTIRVLPAANPNAVFITINELSSQNDTVIPDEDGEFGDWIELYNRGSVSVDMDGLMIEDLGETWVFPSVTIFANQYLIVFASGKDRTAPNLHTNFGLSGSGETVRYRNRDGTVIEQLTFPVHTDDESYGRNPDGTGPYQIFPVATPGSQNGVVMFGDVNGDSNVTSLDASLNARNSVGLITYTNGQNVKGDVSGDATVTSIDASLCGRYAVGLISTFPVEE